MTLPFNGFPVTRTPAIPASAPTALLIHGFLDDATVWDGVVECLGGEVGTVRYDLPGFGARVGSVGEARGATLESLAAEAGEIVEKIDGLVIVVGQSLGTQVAELVAAQRPDRVPGLVLLTPVPLGGTQLPDEVVAPFGALGGDRVAQRSLRGELAPNLAEEQLDRLADIGAAVSPDVVSHYVKVWNDGLSHAPAMSAFPGPVLIVGGGADPFSTEQVVNAVGQRFADADVKAIAEGGHWVHFEYPGAVAAMILDFADAIGRVTL
ncbi:alpha/beta hydrolase [Mycobacterium sp.]|uniref:alpha/beta fold hydrolase n=1 Tax=Mycobacterium sp. TaxID=1785 RepID=UPI002BE64E81|nr:alpha/beta hydrolase [Mycobacterium sp.]HTY35030.1 alpha/beta hydrolase [Mycobacterium sp.]